MVVEDAKSFTIAESHFADAKFYVENASAEETMGSLIQDSNLKGKGVVARSIGDDKNIQGLKTLTLPLTNLEESKALKPPLKDMSGPLVILVNMEVFSLNETRVLILMRINSLLMPDTNPRCFKVSS